jgi:hypothetical protein
MKQRIYPEHPLVEVGAPVFKGDSVKEIIKKALVPT